MFYRIYWWSWLFGPRGPKPIDRIDDPKLGPLRWSEDDDSWVGEYGGYRIAVGYSGSAVPTPDLLAYSRNFLGQKGTTFTQNMAEARAAHAHEFRRWASEFAGLQVGTLGFGMSNRGMGCFVDLAGGEPERSWRVEFDGMKCLGFGFDT
jgi:hypothetical protein